MLLHHYKVHSVNNVVNILITKKNLSLFFDVKKNFVKSLTIYGQLKFNRQLKLMLCTCHTM